MNVRWTSSDIREALVCVIVGYSLVGPLIVLNARPVRRVLVVFTGAWRCPLDCLLSCTTSHAPLTLSYSTTLTRSFTLTRTHSHHTTVTRTCRSPLRRAHLHCPSVPPISSTLAYFAISFEFLLRTRNIFSPLPPPSLPPPAEPHSSQGAVFGLIFPAVNRTTFGLYGSLWPIFNRKSPN